MAVRTKQLAWAVKSGTDLLSYIYTVPSGHRTILKEVRLAERNGGTGLWSLWIEKPTGELIYVIRQSLAAFQVAIQSCWTVMEEGDRIRSYVAPAGAGVLGLVISGTELDLTP